MKVLFVGLGSIGKRHLLNFIEVTKENNKKVIIHAIRSSKRDLGEISDLIDQQFFTYEETDNDYDIIFICSPTFKHFEQVKYFYKRSKALFIEKPIFETFEKDVESINFDEITAYVACPLRFNSAYLYLQELIKQHHILSIRSVCSTYLPEWRDGVDYRSTYSAFKKDGGGVAIDLIHEWDYLIDLFGFPQKVKSLFKKVSALEIDSEDIAIYIASYSDKLAEVHLNYFGKNAVRKMELITTTGTIVLDFINSEVIFNDVTIFKGQESPNDKYYREMSYFIELCLGKDKNINDVTHALKVLKVTETGEYC